MNFFARLAALAGKTLVLIIVLTLLALTLPGDYYGMSPGLDISWAYAINAAGQLGLSHGNDILFTLGPLGWILLPMAVGSNVFYALIFNLCLHVLFFCVLLVHFRHDNHWRLPMFMAGWVILAGIGLSREYHWLILLVLIFGTALRFPADAGVLLLAANLLTPVFLYVKFSLGIGALGTLCLFHAGNIFCRNQGCGRRVVESLLIVTAVAGIFWLALFDSFADCLVWLRGSWELSSGYSVGMALPGSNWELSLGVSLLLLYALCWVLSLRRDHFSGVFLLLTALLCFIVFKHGFVRQDAHVLAFFTALPAIFVVWTLLAGCRMLPVALTALLLSLLPALGVGAKYGVFQGDVFHQLLTGRTAMVKVNYLRDRASYDDMLREQFQNGLRTSVIDDPVIAEIRAGGYGVDVWPWKLSYIPANGLRWQAQPLLQLYSAYTPWLDDFAARHYSHQTASPEFVLLHYGQLLDQRYPAWDAPRTWRAILSHYEWHADIPANGLTILRRRAIPLADGSLLGEAVLSGTDWLEVPESESLLVAELDLPVSLWGRVVSFFFRLPPVSLEVEYNQGQLYRFQLTPAVAGHGIQINYLPERHSQMAQFWRGEAHYAVRRMRLTGAGRGYYPSAAPVKWVELPFPLRYHTYE